MTVSDWIAIGALLVSVLSLYRSTKSLKQSDAASRRSEDIQKRELKVEVLSILSESRNVLHRTYTEIGALKEDFESESQPVQLLLQSRTELFSSYFPKVENAMDSSEADWQSIHEWNDELSHGDLLRRKAELQDKLNDYKFVNDNASGLVSDFRTAMNKARIHVDSAER